MYGCSGARRSSRSALLDDLPRIHHGDLVGDLGHDAEIVSDQDDRHVELALQPRDQVEDLGLNGDVERSRRLVCDQQLRLVGERHRDHRALAHAAGELVRIGVTRPRGRGYRPGRAARRRARRGLASETSRWACIASTSCVRPCRRGAARKAGPGRSSRCRFRGSRGAHRPAAVSRSRPSNTAARISTRFRRGSGP